MLLESVAIVSSRDFDSIGSKSFLNMYTFKVSLRGVTFCLPVGVIRSLGKNWAIFKLIYIVFFIVALDVGRVDTG